jgi:hypothetical protein
MTDKTYTSKYIAIRLYKFLQVYKKCRDWPDWADIRYVEGIYFSVVDRRYKDRICYSS